MSKINHLTIWCCLRRRISLLKGSQGLGRKPPIAPLVHSETWVCWSFPRPWLSFFNKILQLRQDPVFKWFILEMFATTVVAPYMLLFIRGTPASSASIRRDFRSYRFSSSSTFHSFSRYCFCSLPCFLIPTWEVANHFSIASLFILPAKLLFFHFCWWGPFKNINQSLLRPTPLSWKSSALFSVWLGSAVTGVWVLPLVKPLHHLTCKDTPEPLSWSSEVKTCMLWVAVTRCCSVYRTAWEKGRLRVCSQCLHDPQAKYVVEESGFFSSMSWLYSS